MNLVFLLSIQIFKTEANPFGSRRDLVLENPETCGSSVMQRSLQNDVFASSLLASASERAWARCPARFIWLDRKKTFLVPGYPRGAGLRDSRLVDFVTLCFDRVEKF